MPVLNDRAIPSMTAAAVQNKLHRQDLATVTGGKVISSGLVDDPYLDKIELQDHRPERLMVPGVDGLSTRILFFLVQGDGEITVQLRQPEGWPAREEDRAPRDRSGHGGGEINSQRCRGGPMWPPCLPSYRFFS